MASMMKSSEKSSACQRTSDGSSLSIKIENLTKRFGDFTAVDSVSLEVNEGEIFGLLGPNGAGKTTTLSMLSTIAEPTSGKATINGFTLRDKDGVRRTIGIVFQDPSLDDELTGRENLEFHGRLYHMPVDLRKKRIDDVLQLVDLTDKANIQIKKYSGGMKRRLEIARGLMHHPKVLFLDEPTLGLDPQTRRSIWEYVQNLSKTEKLTIILTTHYMEEADFLCNRVAIIDHGKIIAMDTPGNLKKVMGGDIVSLETDKVDQLKDILEKGGSKNVKVLDGKITLAVGSGRKFIPEILRIAEKHNIKITSVKLDEPTLEDVFIHYTGKTIRNGEANGIDRMKQQFMRRR